jgi:putative ABC transport system permease protein
MRLASIAWRGLLARPLRTGLAVAGVALGVAVLTATIITGSASQQALRGVTADLLGSADVRLRAFADAGFQPRTLQALRALPEAAVAAPVSERQLTVSTVPGERDRVFTLLVLGIDPAVDAEIRPPVMAEGTPLTADVADEALVPASWADRHDLGVGDELLLGGRREDMGPVRIVGVLRDSGMAALNNGDVLIMPRAALDAAFEVAAPIRSIDVELAGTDDAAAVEAVTAVLAEPYVVETPEDAAARLAAAQTSFVGLAFLFGLIALIVGAFLVGNTLAMTVAERTRELGLLRAAGTTSRQVLGLVLRQATAIGVAGSLAGLLLGIMLAVLVIGFLSSTRAVLIGGLPLPPVGLAVAFLTGLGITLLGSLVPALRAAGLSPLEALRPTRQPARGLAERLRPVVIGELMLVGLGMVAVVVVGVHAPILPLVLALGLLVGGAIATSFVLEPMGRIIGRPFEWFFGAQGLLGRANLARDRVRTGLTVGAMMIALAAVVALGTVAESARAGTERWVASILPGGHAIRVGLPIDVEEYRATLGATAGLKVASPILELPAVRVTEADRIETAVAGVDPNVFDDEGALIVSGASRSDAFAALRGGGAVLVPRPLAEREGIGVGDVVELGLPGDEPQAFLVAGVLEYTLPARTTDGALLISAADARDRFGVTAASLWAMVPRADVPATAFTQAVRETAAGLAAQPLTARDLAGELSRTLDSLIGLFDVLALVAVVVGALGIVNTLGIGVSERVREIAILRSHGMTVGQVQAMVVAEAAIMGAIAGVLAIATGLAVAFTVVASGASNELAAGLRLPWPLLVAVLLLGTGVAALAGLYPARVAASMPIVRSLKQFE